MLRNPQTEALERTETEWILFHFICTHHCGAWLVVRPPRPRHRELTTTGDTGGRVCYRLAPERGTGSFEVCEMFYLCVL